MDEALAALDVLKEAFDNNATPWYAITICIWSTVFLELWKRKNSVLAYEWDVTNFEETEPDRPEYYGQFASLPPCIILGITVNSPHCHYATIHYSSPRTRATTHYASPRTRASTHYASPCKTLGLHSTPVMTVVFLLHLSGFLSTKYFFDY